MGKQAWQRITYFKTIMVWLAVVLLGIFYLSIRETYEPVRITAMPEAPRQGEPILVTFQLNNRGLSNFVTNYQFYVDGVLLKEGQASINPLSSKTYQYLYDSQVEIGQRVSFTVKTSSDVNNYEKIVSIPSFPPQVASSFISFASFSTTVMSSMATFTHYDGSFATGKGLNVGLVMSLCLILLLIFLELAGAAIEDANEGARFNGGIITLQRFKIRFSTLTGVLFIIFMGIVYTKIVLILSTT
ncbi:MAG: hypothetical protein VR68_11975 [Peptococcaceae bacterium BRH_c4a]|nr:MAG: hypothetical protein VR68_11975 [Peptococcaceae bacterium BRH_c4a]